VREFDVDLDELQNDSTTVTFHGDYESADRERTLRGRLRLAVTHGHNKDHRPGLKQLLYLLTVARHGAVPVLFRVASGNATDDRSHRATWDLLCKLTGRRDFLYVADCKLATAENMAHLHHRGGRFLTVLPRTRAEDAACAIGSRYRGRPIGGHGSMACFSFHPRKVITTGEGGMITTDSAEQARRLRLLRQHGMSVPDTVRHSARQVIIEEYEGLGYNYRLTDIQAAIGIEQLKKLDEIVRRRRELAARYDRALARLTWLKTPHVPDRAEPNYQSYTVTLTDDAPISRNALSRVTEVL
jgi:hypothetical protein